MKPVDTPDSVFEYTFKIQCTSCREVHPKNITINRVETHEIHGSRGSANFVFKCSFCGKESSASIISDAKPYTAEQSEKPGTIVEIEARGIDFIEFVPDGDFTAKSAVSGAVFEDVDLTDEFYDADEKTFDEVSITDIKWEIARG